MAARLARGDVALRRDHGALVVVVTPAHHDGTVECTRMEWRRGRWKVSEIERVDEGALEVLRDLRAFDHSHPLPAPATKNAPISDVDRQLLTRQLKIIASLVGRLGAR